MTIKEALRILTANGAEIYCKICTVDAIDEDARTVDVSPLDESAPILGVNLQANQNGKIGLVAFPKEGSHVVVAFLNDAAALVVLSEQVDKFVGIVGDGTPVEFTAADNSLSVTVGDTTITADGAKHITLNGGDLGGLAIVQEVRDSLNSIKSYCETMKSAVSTGIKAVGAGTAANGTMGATAFDSAMSSARIEIKSMENGNIKHG